jgi:hypothetical protein
MWSEGFGMGMRCINWIIRTVKTIHVSHGLRTMNTEDKCGQLKTLDAPCLLGGILFNTVFDGKMDDSYMTLLRKLSVDWNTSFNFSFNPQYRFKENVVEDEALDVSLSFAMNGSYGCTIFIRILRRYWFAGETLEEHQCRIVTCSITFERNGSIVSHRPDVTRYCFPAFYKVWAIYQQRCSTTGRPSSWSNRVRHMIRWLKDVRTVCRDRSARTFRDWTEPSNYVTLICCPRVLKPSFH